MPAKLRKPIEYGWQERTLTPLQYRRVLTELGLSLSAAARFLGISYRTRPATPTALPSAADSRLLLRAMLEFDQVPVVPYWQKP
jgi:hypothetical protein